MRRLYQVAAEGCAEIVARTPALEAPFTRVGARVWASPAIGRFYRSTAHRVAARLKSSGRPFRMLTVAGAALLLDATEFTTFDLYFGGHVYESATTAYLAGALRRGQVFVDIGANHGYFSMLAAAKVGEGGRVVSFEPNPSVFAQLETHTRLNGFERRIELRQVALADEPNAGARFFVSRSAVNTGLSSLSPAAEALQSGVLSDAHTISVPVDTFDRWFAASGLSRIDVVKIDVEGAEAAVLAGMNASIAAGAIDALIVETMWGSPAHEALCAAGYSPRLLDAVGALSNVLYAKTERA